MDHYTLDVYPDSSPATPFGLRSDRFGCFHHALFDRITTYNAYRAVLCHLGNAPEYGFVLDFLKTHQAIGVLQDFGLARLHLAPGGRGGSGRRGRCWTWYGLLRRSYGRPASCTDRSTAIPSGCSARSTPWAIALNRMVFEGQRPSYSPRTPPCVARAN